MIGNRSGSGVAGPVAVFAAQPRHAAVSSTPPTLISGPAQRLEVRATTVLSYWPATSGAVAKW